MDTTSKKTPGIIDRITLTEATYAYSQNNTFEPTIVNFIYGKNGTGKSTIARAIKNNSGLHYLDRVDSNEYVRLVFNRDFIDDNFSDYEKIPGVFMISKENAEAVKGLHDAEERLSTYQNKLQSIKQRYDEKKSEIDDLTSVFKDECNKKMRDAKIKLTSQYALKGHYQSLLKEILEASPKINPVNHNLDDLIKFQTVAYDKFAEKIVELDGLNDIKISECDLLFQKVMIKNIGSASFSSNASKWGVIDWIAEGHKYHNTGGLCPYCQQKLQSNFEQQFNSCFDEDYQKMSIEVVNYRTYFLKTMNEVKKLMDFNLDILKNNPLLSHYHLEEAYKKFQDNAKLNFAYINEKITHPSKAISKNEWIDLNKLLQDIREEIGKINSEILKYNTTILKKRESKKRCLIQIKEYFRHLIDNEINEFDSKISKLNTETRVAQYNYVAAQEEHRLLAEEVQEKREKLATITSVANSINTILNDSGFQGFKLQESSLVPGTYEVVRDGSTSRVINLSEGERNFIAFVYFYSLIKGSTDKNTLSKNKIVVIDDPVSSMDGDSLFIISSIIRELIETTLNHVSYYGELSEPCLIKQLFILTHNSIFYNSISDDYVSEYKNVSFYKTLKHNNTSSIKLLVAEDPLSIHGWCNVSPVKNSYKELWVELKNTKSSAGMINIIRQILYYYFVELSGYKLDYLIEKILVKNRDKLVTIGADGKEDTSCLIAARTMLSSITSSNGINDSMYLALEDDTKSKMYKNIFEAIFNIMGQHQHFEHMMK